MAWFKRKPKERITKADGRIADLVRGHRDAARGVTECPFPAGTDAAQAWLAGQQWHSKDVTP